MIINLKKISTMALTVFAGLLFLVSNVFADQALPFLDYVGNFYYCDGTRRGEAWCTEKGSPRNSEQHNYSLVFYISSITGVNYIDGSCEDDPSNDPVLNAWFEIGTLYNDDYPNNLIFSGVQPSGGIPGPVNFSITDGTNTFLEATLHNVIISNDYFGTNLYDGYITDVTYDSSAPYSCYIEELKASSLPFNPDMNFSFYSYTSDFTADAFGSVQGILSASITADNDGDGYTDDVDCDDYDPGVHPGAVEDCLDEIDNDCDNLIDTADPDAVNCFECTDSDGDTYNVDGGSCGPVDCDDLDFDVNPGVVEDCSNNIDDDCDTLVDGDDSECGACIPTSEREKGKRKCNDGIDNDCDGVIDGDDPDCNR